MMKKKNTIVCIFAHPDDEAFGPGGTIALLAAKNDLYLICVTNGDAGKNSSQKKESLGEIRKAEVTVSGEILGIKKIFFLEYKDGSLCNNIYHQLAGDIEKILTMLKPQTLLTYENRGISGHIDHITVSMVASYLFERLSFVKMIMYYCISVQSRKHVKNYFIHFPKGYAKTHVDKIINTKSVWKIKSQAMLCHQSQLHDITRVMQNQEKLPKEEYFLIKKKK